MKNLPKYLSFCTMAVLIVMMMAATVLEKVQGSPAAFRWVYHNPLFVALWAVAAISGICYLISRGVGKKYWTLSLHLSFAVILVGALVTFLFGEKGTVRLPEGETVSLWQKDDGVCRNLPGTLSLQSFEVERYAGSEAPSDYRSTVAFRDSSDSGTFVISMNHIARWKGYRLYQSGFDKEGGSVLMVSHDPWGVGITYTGYLLLLLSMIGFFFQKNSGFRSALKRISGMAAAVVLLLLVPANLDARKMPGDTPKVLPSEVADAFGEIYVYYNDRVCPFETLARDYTLKAYGKPHWNDFSATQVVTGWLFYYDWWNVVPFKVKAKDRGTPRESEKEYLFRSTASGDAWKIFPVADSTGAVTWYNSNEMLPLEVIDNHELWTFIRKMLDVVEESVRDEDWAEVTRLAGRIKAYQEKVVSPSLPSPAKVRAERLYNRISRPMVPFMAAITLGMILFVLMGIRLSKGRGKLRGSLVLAALGALLWIYLTLVLGLRWYVSGHAPFAGSYCVMMLMAWLSCIGMVLLYRKFPLIQPLGFLLAGFTMLMASMAGANPQITHLMPVLQSPLLSIHVLSMMISYTLFGLVALNGIMGLTVPPEASERLKDVSLVVLYPAVFLLTFGTFLGAVWANISWGSYWAWDPKETWALVTILIYAFALHQGSFKVLRNPKFFHIYSTVAFLAVLVTYFGVNLFLGGMHAYS